jgi:hypothetical protein
MSSNPDFFVQGLINPGQDVYIVAKTTGMGTEITPPGDATQSPMWSVMGVKPSFAHIEDISDKKYYFRDMVDNRYYWPLTIKTPITTTNSIITFSKNGDGFFVKGTAATNTDCFYMQYDDSLDSGGTTISGNANIPPTKDYLNCLSLINLPITFAGTETDSFTFRDISNPHYISPGPNPKQYMLQLNSNTQYQAPLTITKENHMYNMFSHSSIQCPNLATAECIFFNPYQSVMNSTFHIKQVDGGVSFTHQKPLMSKFSDYKYIKHDFTVEKNGPASVFTLSTTKNIDTVHIYAGVPYTLTYPDLDRSIQNPGIKIPNINGQKTTDTFLEGIGLKENSSNPNPNPNPNSNSNSNPKGYMLNVNDQNQDNIYNNSTRRLIDTQTVFYFVPHHMYHIGHGSRLEYTLYNPIDVLVSWIYQIKLPAIPGSITGGGPYTQSMETGPLGDMNTLAFSTNSAEATVGIVTRYCEQNEYCGNCQGVAENVNYRGSRCILDSESLNNHRIGDHTAVLTTDHERYLESSNHVKRAMVHNHGNTLIIILVVIILVVIAGFILFEERKMILKHSLSIKNGRHHAP